MGVLTVGLFVVDVVFGGEGVVIVGEEFFEVFVVVISVDGEGGDFVVFFEESVFVGFEGVGDFYVGFVDGGVVFAVAVGDGGEVVFECGDEAVKFGVGVVIHGVIVSHWSWVVVWVVCSGAHPLWCGCAPGGVLWGG